MLRTLFRMLPASLPVCLMLRTLFHMLHLPSFSRPHSILQCLLMPSSLPPVFIFVFVLLHNYNTKDNPKKKAGTFLLLKHQKVT
jgi:hypothetical protein